MRSALARIRCLFPNSSSHRVSLAKWQAHQTKDWRAGGDSLRTNPPDTDTLEKLQEVFNALEEWDEYLRQNAPAFKAGPNGRGAKP